MSVETRKSGKTYFYRKVRQGRRVVSEYLGAGAEGGVRHELEQIERDERQAAAASRRAVVAALLDEEREAWALLTKAQQFAALAMLAAGYHRSHRGQWRRRRYTIVNEDRTPGQMLAEIARRRLEAEVPRREVEPPPLPAPDDLSSAARQAIMARCNRSDATAEDLEALRRLLAHSPALVTKVGDTMRVALGKAAELVQSTPLLAVVSNEHLVQRRRALGYHDSPALERPLVDHLLTCELRLAYVELRYSTALQGGLSWDDAAHWDRMLGAAQRRYLAAVECLARVRRVRVELARFTSPDGTRGEALAVDGPGG